MKLVNLYRIDGSVDSNGNYILDKTLRTVIAECTSDNVDKGCYYFAFLTYKQNAAKVQTQSLSFIEIPNLLTLLSKNISCNLTKIELDENIQRDYENYLNKSYEARNEIVDLAGTSKIQQQNSADDKKK